MAKVIKPCASPFSGTIEWTRSDCDFGSEFSKPEGILLSDESGGAKVSSNHCPNIGSLSSSKNINYHKFFNKY